MQQVPCDKKLGRSPHGGIDRRTLASYRSFQWLRPGIEATQVTLVELHGCCLIFLGIGGVFCLVFV